MTLSRQTISSGSPRLQVVDHLEHFAKFFAGSGQFARRDQVMAASQEKDGLEHLVGMAQQDDKVLAARPVVGREPVAHRPGIGPGEANHDLHRRWAAAILASQSLRDRLDKIEAVSGLRKSFSQI